MQPQEPPGSVPSSSRQVYFLVGAQRSGSTLLRLMLDHHPQVACLDEFNFALDTLNPDGSEPDRITMRERLEATRGYSQSYFQLDPSLEFSAAVHALLDGMLRHVGDHKQIVGVTIHRHFREAVRYWPHARFIHLVRDPRDVAPSVMAMGWAGTTWHATQLWRDAERELERLQSEISPDRVVQIRFEDLVCRPADELARLCKLLGVAYSPLMLTYPSDTTYPAPDPTAVARWRGRMPDRDVQLIELRVGEQMIARGYELSGLPPIGLSPLQLSRFALQDRAFRLRWGVRTFGAFPVLTHAVASHVGLSAIAARARRRMQEIERENLR